MKRFLLALIVLISLGLCLVCVLQWQREALLRGRIVDLVKQLEAENKLRFVAEQKVHEYSQEILRLEGLRAEIESKLLDATEDLRDRTVDQMIQSARSGKKNILEGSKAARQRARRPCPSTAACAAT